MTEKEPEHLLIELCRRIMAECPLIHRIQFRVDREDEWQSAEFGELPERREEQ